MRRLVVLVTLALAFASPDVLLAEARVAYREQGRALFSFDVPDFWTVQVGGVQRLSPPGDTRIREVPQVISMRPTVEPRVWIGFISPPRVTTLAEGRDYLREIGRFIASSRQITDARSHRIGGMPAEIFSGTGRRGGKPLRFVAALIDLPGPRVAIVVSVVEAGADPAFVETINSVFGSFRASN
jgi:hypothetical protein